MELKGKRVLVVGLGKSGVAAARFLHSKGARVTVNDHLGEADLGDAISDLKDLGLEMVLGGHPANIFKDQDIVVTSPGVPRDMPGFLEAARAGIPVISELELAFRFVSEPVVAVTGTNGKTTVANLLAEIFRKRHGQRVFLGGNIGNPLTELVIEKRRVDVIICEVSSFQLEFIETFRPKVGIMLNLTDDHLDRYRDRDDYAEVKSRLFRYQEPHDWAVLNSLDPLVERMAEKIRSRIIWFGDEGRKPAVFTRAGEMIYVGPEGDESRIPIREYKLPGRHNLENLLASSAAALAMGIDPAAIAEAVGEFRGLPHRIEFIREERGIRYYNDSKGTNVGAVRVALETFSGPVIILMGGLAKGCRFEELKPVMKGRVKAIVTYGESRNQIAGELASQNQYEVSVVENLEQAVLKARAAAAEGDVILLSPGCASFDQFRDYKHRGDVFRETVMKI